MPLTDADRQRGIKASRKKRQNKRLERIKEAHTLFDNGLSKAKIAKEMDVTVTSVNNYLKEHLPELFSEAEKSPAGCV